MTGPAVPADDRGLLLGDGLFETMLAVDGAIGDFDAHLARMTRGAAVLGLPAPGADEALTAAEAALAEARLTEGTAAVRLTLTAGSGRGLERPEPLRTRLFATASAAPRAAGPARLRMVTIRRNDTSPAARVKTLAYLDNILARRQARDLGGDEALLLNTRGELACAAAANLFWIEGGRLFTPALGCGVLDGVMRGRVLAAARDMAIEAVEARAEPADLLGAEALFLTNSLMGVRPVGELDGRAFTGHALVEAISSRCR